MEIEKAPLVFNSTGGIGLVRKKVEKVQLLCLPFLQKMFYRYLI